MNPMLQVLRERAMRLPLSPGVYLMKDENGKIIYVGKSKVLKNRVSQYFSGSAHDRKTEKMISYVRDFAYMLTDTEMEALSLENRLIKLHMPKFNICLRDSKTYPYLKITNEAYPHLQLVRKRLADGGRYFGPYSGSAPVYALMKTVERIFGIPTCRRIFPRDIGKDRPCLYAQIGQCVAPCTGKISEEEFRALYAEVELFLKGHFATVEESLKEKMMFASDNLRFEAAAHYRDRIAALQKLRQHQKIIAAPNVEQDIFAFFEDETCACLAVYYVRGGCVMDSDHFLFSADQMSDPDTLTAFLTDLYLKREYIPKDILIGFDLGAENASLLSDFLQEKCGGKVLLRFPERANPRALCDMVYRDAKQHAASYRAQTERDNEVLIRLAQTLALEVVPEHIEAFDISNLGNEHITAGMVVLKNGRFSKKDYRTYKIKFQSGQNDYGAMREAIDRRLQHAEEAPLPDLFLLDGGKGHVSVIRALLAERAISIPVFGMVKDEYHKTRALTDEEREISIAKDQGIFTMLYRLQEEVHRYTVSRMTNAKRKTLRTSSLEEIPGIGAAKARALLQKFHTISAIKNATAQQLRTVPGISPAIAQEIISYFQKQKSTSPSTKKGETNL